MELEVIFPLKKKKLTNNNSECLSLIRAGVSNTRPGGQKQPGTDSSRAHWVALENVKEGINVGLLTVFSSVLQLLQFNSYNFSLSIIEIYYVFCSLRRRLIFCKITKTCHCADLYISKNHLGYFLFNVDKNMWGGDICSFSLF